MRNASGNSEDVDEVKEPPKDEPEDDMLPVPRDERLPEDPLEGLIMDGPNSDVLPEVRCEDLITGEIPEETVPEDPLEGLIMDGPNSDLLPEAISEGFSPE